MIEPSETQPDTPRRRWLPRWSVDLAILLYILVMGAYFRWVGIDWGENQYLHPDERFLVWVGSDITPRICEDRAIPVEACPEEKKGWMGFGEYFDTATSTLNPNNRGHGFYVYGTLPLFIARYIVEWTYGHSGFSEMTAVGRPLSALADLLTILLVFGVARRLYDQRVGLLAAAFYAAAVLPIQLSHFYKEDTFLNFFTFLAIYFSVRLLVKENGSRTREDEPLEAVQFSGAPEGWSGRLLGFVRRRDFWMALAFGAAFGCAMASKLNALPVAALLPAAYTVRLLGRWRSLREKEGVALLAQAALYVGLAAAVSAVVFRLFQPYAFAGPGILGVRPNDQWVANIREQRNQSTGDVDFPPALQWARRPVTFAGENLLVWGLGLPLGLLAAAGFLWAGWRSLASLREPGGEWQRHALPWLWTGAYFVWQSSAFNPTMRYLLPIYPTLAIFAAWAVFAMLDLQRQAPAGQAAPRWARPAGLAIGSAVLLATILWAYAFTRIYTRPVTRIAATRWVYQNVPGPVNLRIQTGAGAVYNQPLPFPAGLIVRPGQPFTTNFTPKAGGSLSEVTLAHLADLGVPGEAKTLRLTVTLAAEPDLPLATAILPADVLATAGLGGSEFTFLLDQTIPLAPQTDYVIVVEVIEGQGEINLCGPLVLTIQTSTDPVNQRLLQPEQCTIEPGLPYGMTFQPKTAGVLSEIRFQHISNLRPAPGDKQLSVAVTDPANPGGAATGTLTGSFTPGSDPRGAAYTFRLDPPLEVKQDGAYILSLSLTQGEGALAVAGSAPTTETTWDDAIPLRMDGYDGYGGIYRGDLNNELYWDDNADKLQRLLDNLDRADYVFITSNRQWGTTTRVPERYPLTTEYYRRLMGCPLEQEVITCYNLAQVGAYRGDLGFELVQVFDSSPNLGPLVFNTQFAEEAFTVYDHPKVFIFKKTAEYDPQRAQDILGAVDLSLAVHITPRKAGAFPANLMLPADRWAEQRLGGTWAELFDPAALVNRSQPVSVVIWYLAITLLGWLVYPLLRLALPGLADRAYPMARLAGMLLLAWLSWLAGSAQIPFTRPTILAAAALIAALGLAAALYQRETLLAELRRDWRTLLAVEGVTLAFFAGGLLLRLGNPDLWHPWKGGEKPMDFSYLNAVLKSTSFPPYDPWFAGGYLNYYYYGFVLVGAPIKLLGITPSVAYNLLLPTMFTAISMGAFSMGWNLAARIALPEGSLLSRQRLLWGAALAAALGMAVLGNQGTVRMIYQGYQRLAAPGGVIEGVDPVTGLQWALQGAWKTLSGEHLPYGVGDWYWIPSRAIPPGTDVEPITEFPFFTALYADPHAHLFAIPITLLALACFLSVVNTRLRWPDRPGAALWLLWAGLAVGALRPTNTWDFYPYLALGGAAVLYAGLIGIKDDPPASPAASRGLEPWLWSVLRANLVALLFAGAAMAFYQPFADWYGQGYTQVNIWRGSHTPVGSYFVHWGLFLLVIVAWMAWETRDWMAKTPVSALRRLVAPLPVILVILLVLVALIAGLWLLLSVEIAWLVLPLAAWAGVLILRPGQPDAKRFVLFLIGTGLTLTLMVEVIVLVGDIGRMNTVFKFYLQTWTLFAVSAAAALGWTLAALPEWGRWYRTAWQAGLAILVAGAALFPLLGGMAKIRDRMVDGVPLTLDGMDYMQYARYGDDWGEMDLSRDYRAIRWMQANVTGSPVIVEANMRRLYRWGSRYTIYTGLPGVVGWEWHQQQQRALLPPTIVTNRILEIDEFYLTTDLAAARAFLRKYDVRYIIVGQIERGHYGLMAQQQGRDPLAGLDKFAAADGVLWKSVYADGDTVIYEVLP